jgi:ornithine cyclodeaminase/alanine dehydrogenase-like protein (mu-crystallin family)
MPLFLSNEEIDQLITMKDTMEALEILYREMGEGAAVTAPRSDVHSPTAAAQSSEGPMAHYLKSMSGASPHFGTAALRFSSDIVTWRDSGGGIRREKLPMLPGNRWMGIVLLFSSANGELLAIMNDGVLQRFRVGGANGVATKYLARKDSQTVGLIGSGWQAGTQVMAVCQARDIKTIKVFSPTKANREKFAEETSARVGVEIAPVDSYEEAVKGVDIIITSTNARRPFLSQWALAEGMHISAMQRDEFDDGALLACHPLVVHTHSVEIGGVRAARERLAGERRAWLELDQQLASDCARRQRRRARGRAGGPEQH